MKRSIPSLPLSLLLLAGPLFAAELWPEDVYGKVLVQEARQRVLAWHGAEAGSVSNVIRVAYFHPADREPLQDWRARSERILADVSDFYRDGMNRLGVGPYPFPFERDPDGFVIRRVKGKHPSERYDHDSSTTPALVEQGQFSCRVAGLRPGDARVRLSVLHCNGAARNFDYHVETNRSGRPHVEVLNAASMLAPIEAAVRAGDVEKAKNMLGDDARSEIPAGVMGDKLGILRDLVDPPDPVDLRVTSEKSISLSDAEWTEATVGWSRLSRNIFDLDQTRRNSIYLELGGRMYAKGLYAPSPARFSFDLGDRWKQFTATIGLRDGAASQGSAVFQVMGDGKELYRSAVLRAGEKALVKVGLSGVKRLELRTEGGEGHPHNSWAIWVDPYVKR